MNFFCIYNCHSSATFFSLCNNLLSPLIPIKIPFLLLSYALSTCPTMHVAPFLATWVPFLKNLTEIGVMEIQRVSYHSHLKWLLTSHCRIGAQRDGVFIRITSMVAPCRWPIHQGLIVFLWLAEHRLSIKCETIHHAEKEEMIALCNCCL